MFYGLDLLLRMMRIGVKEASLISDEDLMTLVRLHSIAVQTHANEESRYDLKIARKVGSPASMFKSEYFSQDASLNHIR